MNTREKSLELAELMPELNVRPHYKNETRLYTHELHNIAEDNEPEDMKMCPVQYFNPYSDDIFGRAQFASILLKFPEVMGRHDLYMWNHPNGAAIGATEPTQANILDEILRMNGVDV